MLAQQAAATRILLLGYTWFLIPGGGWWLARSFGTRPVTRLPPAVGRFGCTGGSITCAL
jgi:hypothetical protein